ncbi:MAG: adventurous gliding motility protein R [Bdellovibrio sp. CG10_big_fil_rev_8_21_14_0_10_47_8]|nr:MAG: adventurous gliding motility protein R [Bdellovibrio sp. CG10_big_fil_rev_8_21_14_0_10_47_8]
MNELIKNARILICVGSGGVGKTTVASAIALRGAQMGRRVLVLTIDPSRRLKSTMGLQEADEAAVSHPSIQSPGTLTAAVINNQKTFDQFVSRAADRSEAVKKIFKNKLYIQLSTTLSGSQEFTALEKLYSSYESGLYDLIVLDTPPTKHAIDFLQSPQKLSALFNEKMARWFRDPGGEKMGFFSNLIRSGTRQVFRALEILTGSEFIRELADFFQSIQGWQSKLQDRIQQVGRLMADPQTHFLLVTSFDSAKLKEAEYFSQEIQKGGYHLSVVIINRSYPQGLDLDQKVQGQTPLEKTYLEYQDFYIQRRELYRKFSIRMSGARELNESSEKQKDQVGDKGEVVNLPEMSHDISDLEGIVEIAKNIAEV